MEAELRALIERKWFQDRPEGTRRSRTSADELSQLTDSARSELADLYRECFDEEGEGDELARFVDAISVAEYGLDSSLLVGRQERRGRREKFADFLDWPVARFDHFTRWWDASAHHRELSQRA
jgi:hypothetical protein